MEELLLLLLGGEEDGRGLAYSIAGGEEEKEEGGCWYSAGLSASSRPPSNTTKFAFAPGGTVTTQKLAPPTPSVLVPSISFTWCLDGSIAHGRPLQLPSHSILTPHVGILLRNGVAGSR